jgi:membrane-associated phospholipid phosphatase
VGLFAASAWTTVNEAPDFRRLLLRTLLALLAGVAVVALCYYFIDRPVAFFVHDNRLPEHAFLKWLTYPPPILQSWAPAALAALFVRRAWGPFRRWELALLAACVGMILADQFRDSLGYCLGRTWPSTWIEDNPSLIRDGAFGFHPLHGGEGYMSCPSGHTARTVALVAPFWVSWPRWRWALALAPAAVAVGLVGMNYHFVGDVIAGGLVGGVVGAYTARCCGVVPPERQ